MSDELRKTQDVCAALRQQLDAANLRVSEAQKKADGYLAIIVAIRGAILTDPEAKVCPEFRVALQLDADTALDLQRVRRDVTEAAKAIDQNYVDWKTLGLAGVRMQEALTSLAEVERARIEKGLPLEAGDALKRNDGKGVFCLDHKKVMTNGICPKCEEQ